MAACVLLAACGRLPVGPEGARRAGVAEGGGGAELRVAARVEAYRIEVGEGEAFVEAVLETVMHPGERRAFTVRLLRERGERVVPVAAAEVKWAATNPGLAGVDPVCTTDAGGSCSVVVSVGGAAEGGEEVGVAAVYGGVAGRIRVEVR